jgi:MFS superfamily sulfate permease-like transporter
LVAQGLGNIAAGLVGGIPMTAVIIRGSANVQAGGRTRKSAFFHGLLLLLAVMVAPDLLSKIPLAALAAILLHVGFRLAPPDLFRQMLRAGSTQVLPFFATFLALVFTDLLTGVVIGLVVGVYFVLRAHVSAPYSIHRLSSTMEGGHEHARIELAESVSFLNKAAINALLHTFPDGSIVEIDARRCRHIDPDVVELFADFVDAAPARNIDVHLRGFEAGTRLGNSPSGT